MDSCHNSITNFISRFNYRFKRWTISGPDVNSGAYAHICSKLAAIVIVFWITMGFMTQEIVSFFHNHIMPLIIGG